MRLLLEFWSPCETIDAEEAQARLLASPGVLSVRIDAAASQAEVTLSPDEYLSLPQLKKRIWLAGYAARVALLPDPDEDSDYARYYYAPDSPLGRWVD